jgi:hypothetical protein
MGRFVGTISTRSGGQESGFTRAKIFSTPGTTTWAIPSTTTKIKVFVIGAGTNYNQMIHCSQSNNCLSGQTSLGCCYCLNFIGHAMGAGGGYAEKTLVNPNGTASITVGAKAGSVGGTPTNSQFTLGSTSVTAYSATHVNSAWSCVNNTTARDSTYDNDISYGFKFPICGYQNCLTGYWQRPGYGVGGDINRDGGAGVVIPEFRNDSAIYPSSYPTLGGGASGATIWCTCSLNYVDTSFGYVCYSCAFMICAGSAGGGSALACGLNPYVGTILYPGTETQRRNLPTAGSLDGPLLAGTAQSSGGGTINCTTIQCNTYSYNYSYGWTGYWCMCSRLCTSATGGGGSSPATITYDPAFKKYSSKPTGIGASSGLSDKAGVQAKPEAFTVTPINDGIPSGGGGGSPLQVCICSNSSALGDCQCWLNARICNCSFCPCYCFFAAGGGASTPPPYYDVTYIQTETAFAEVSGGVLNTNNLLDDNGNNLPNIRYGQGAGTTAATYGGGGNRTQAGGDGLVVVMYNI